MKDDTVSRASVLKAIDEYERLSMVSQTVRNMTSLREIVQWLPAVQTCEDAVSRQAAIKTLEKGLPSEPLKSKYTEGITVGFGLAITWIEQLPAVQSQPIVRCKDCRFQDKGRNESESWNLCRYRPWLHVPTEDEHYCGYAERRIDEQTD